LRHARYFAQVLGSAGDLFQTGGDALQESLALFDRERTKRNCRAALGGSRDRRLDRARAIGLAVHRCGEPRYGSTRVRGSRGPRRLSRPTDGLETAPARAPRSTISAKRTPISARPERRSSVTNKYWSSVGRELVGTPSVVAGLRAALFGAEMPETSNATKAARDSLARAPGAASANDRSAKCGLIPTYARSIHLAVC
jgi:hypothetical protein